MTQRDCDNFRVLEVFLNNVGEAVLFDEDNEIVKTQHGTYIISDDNGWNAWKKTVKHFAEVYKNERD